jgi:NADH-quinone oxidoreductase subunit M
MNLSLLILLPVITSLAILLMRDSKQVRAIALLGSALQLGLVGWLVMSYHNERVLGNTSQMLFESRYVWFSAFHIQYYVGWMVFR